MILLLNITTNLIALLCIKNMTKVEIAFSGKTSYLSENMLKEDFVGS